MGFLGDLIDDVLDIPAKTIKAVDKTVRTGANAVERTLDTAVGCKPKDYDDDDDK